MSSPEIEIPSPFTKKAEEEEAEEAKAAIAARDARKDATPPSSPLPMSIAPPSNSERLALAKQDAAFLQRFQIVGDKIAVRLLAAKEEKTKGGIILAGKEAKHDQGVLLSLGRVSKKNFHAFPILEDLTKALDILDISLKSKGWLEALLALSERRPTHGAFDTEKTAVFVALSKERHNSCEVEFENSTYLITPAIFVFSWSIGAI